jgi:hypothetical protein
VATSQQWGESSANESECLSSRMIERRYEEPDTHQLVLLKLDLFHYIKLIICNSGFRESFPAFRHTLILLSCSVHRE